MCLRFRGLPAQKRNAGARNAPTLKFRGNNYLRLNCIMFPLFCQRFQYKGCDILAVFRVEKSSDYTVMSNHHLRNHALSLKAKGLLSQMLSLPEEWDYTLAGLAEINKESKDAIRSAVEELEQAGYIQRRQTQDKTGKFSGNEYVIREMPVPPDTEQDCPPDVDNDGEQPEPDTALPLLDFPTTEKPSTEKPLTENPTELNKDISSKDNIIPPKAPQGGRRKKREAKTAPDWKPERFAGFWEYYRTHCRGESKQAAIRAWDRLRPDDALIDQMGMALRKQIQSQDWQAGIGIPYASTWLNNRRWEDEPKAADRSRSPAPIEDEVIRTWI